MGSKIGTGWLLANRSYRARIGLAVREFYGAGILWFMCLVFSIHDNSNLHYTGMYYYN